MDLKRSDEVEYLNVFDNVTYGYSCYIASVINYYLESDRTKGLEMLNKFLMFRNKLNIEEVFSYVGINNEDSPKIFKKEIERCL